MSVDLAIVRAPCAMLHRRMRSMRCACVRKTRKIQKNLKSRKTEFDSFLNIDYIQVDSSRLLRIHSL